MLSAARSHPAREPAAGPLRGPGSDWRAVGPRQGRAGSRAALLDGPGCPQSAAALLARGPKTRGLWGRLSFEKPLAVPPTTSVYPATALSRTADLRPPVTPASSARKRPQPAPPSPGAEPEPQGVSRRQPESPRAEAPPVGAPGAFPASEGACPARPGTGGETEADEVPTRCGMGLHGMGVGRGERCFQGPLPSCGPSRVTPRPGKPDSNASPARDVDLLGQGSLIGDAKACPAPYPRRARMAAPGLGAHKDLGRGVWSTPQHKMYLWKLTVGVIGTAGVEGKEEGSDFLAPRSAGGMSRRRPVRRGGSEARLCGENACYALSLGLTHSPVARGWHMESLPPGSEVGSSPLPPLAWGNGVWRVYRPQRCSLDLPYP